MRNIPRSSTRPLRTSPAYNLSNTALTSPTQPSTNCSIFQFFDNVYSEKEQQTVNTRDKKRNKENVLEDDKKQLGLSMLKEVGV